MTDDEIWSAVDDQRRQLARLLDDLTPEEWRTPSLCEGWTVRDVVGHLAWQEGVPHWSDLALALKARGSPDRLIHDAACQWAERPTDQLVQEIRGRIGSRRTVPGGTRLETLIDALLHGQDISRPLGRPLPVPAEAARAAADQIWAIVPVFNFTATKRLRDLRFTAYDTDWAAGSGPEVRAPIAEILMVLSGRPADTELMSGDGVATALERLGHAT